MFVTLRRDVSRAREGTSVPGPARSVPRIRNARGGFLRAHEALPVCSGCWTREWRGMRRKWRVREVEYVECGHGRSMLRDRSHEPERVRGPLGVPDVR